MRLLRHRSLLAALSFAAAIVAGTARANQCTNPSPQCDPDDKTTGACCDPNCNWRADGDDCIVPVSSSSTQVCKVNQCKGTTHTCDKVTSTQAPDNTPCSPWQAGCLVGACQNGTCTNAVGGLKCVDNNPCTDNNCTPDGVLGNFDHCSFPASSNTTDCSTTQNGVCTIQQCDGNGNCVATTNPPTTKTCPPPSAACKVSGCAIVNSTPTCVERNAAKGTPCDDDPLDCEWQLCDDSGTCRHQAAPGASQSGGVTCDPDCVGQHPCTDTNHCHLSVCDAHRGCKTGQGAPYNASPGVTMIQTLTSTGTTLVPSCPSDGNVCTSDECDGNDSTGVGNGLCRDRNLTGTACSDGNDCTGGVANAPNNDTCQTGVCTAGACDTGHTCGQSCGNTLTCTLNGSTCACQ